MLTINNGDPLFTRNLSLNKSTYRYLQMYKGKLGGVGKW